MRHNHLADYGAKEGCYRYPAGSNVNQPPQLINGGPLFGINPFQFANIINCIIQADLIRFTMPGILPPFDFSNIPLHVSMDRAKYLMMNWAFISGNCSHRTLQ